MSAASRRIRTEKSDGVGWLTFDNPERHNAMSLEMWHATGAAFVDFESDPSIRVVVMRGAGAKAFVSGADISQFAEIRKNAEQAAVYSATLEAGKKPMDDFGKPLIAMIEGYCFGGGVRVALSADIRIASENSVFAIPAAKLGLGYSFESVRKLADVVGPAVSKELLYTGRRIDAREALRIGLVNRLAPPDQLEAVVGELARDIARNAPLTIRAAKLAVDQALLDPADRDMARVEATIRACFDSEDYASGQRAFMEKRVPEFVGR